MGWRDFQGSTLCDNVDKVTMYPFEDALCHHSPLCHKRIDSENEVKAVQTEEAARLLRSRGWVQIRSTYLDQDIYLVKHEAVKVPDPSLPRYTQSETAALKGLNREELLTLCDVKEIFNGTISEGRK
tara:strand:- start:79 stop:459 length:381 start_codon:yes stop_codon:yes gene_type:complete